jgi:hypothetical protein
MRYGFIILAFLSSLVCLTSTVYGAEGNSSQKIIMSTFDVNSAGTYAYLRDGVQSMLVSRLSIIEGAELLDQRVSALELAKLKKGAEEGKDTPVEIEADYLVTGALFALTRGLNIQVVFYPLSQGVEIERFSVVAEDDAAIISTLDGLSQDIAVRVFGHERAVPGVRSRQEQQAGAKGFVTIHPEVAYKKGLYSGSVIDIGDSAIKVSAQGVRRTTELSLKMLSMVVGDADGDGSTELILLTERDLRVFQFIGRKASEVAKTTLPASIKVHAINMADIDNNGRKEIYLSATKDLNVSSLIMEWDKTAGFTTTKQFIPWYIRPIDHPTRGLILAGQKRGFKRTDFLERGVFQLAVNDKGAFAAAGEISLPGSVNLFDFTYADIDGDKIFEKIVIDQNEKLKIYDQENGLIWVSSQQYGGSKTYIGPSQGIALDRNQNTNLSADEDADRELFFVPGRIAVTDLDKNGRQDIVVVNNVEVSGSNWFNRVRLYDGGSIVGLTWNGSELVETWRTGRHSGFVADFDFSLKKDMTTGSKGEKGIATLYIGQIPNSGTMESILPGMDKTKLSMYELGFSLKKAEIE